jgi:hypothetical protein
MGYASYLVYTKGGGFPAMSVPLGVYAAQLALNFAWTPLFFVAHRLDLALVDIVAMWGAIVATIALFHPVIGGWALGLLLPYLAWVSFATALNAWIWRNNRGPVRFLCVYTQTCCLLLRWGGGAEGAGARSNKVVFLRAHKHCVFCCFAPSKKQSPKGRR